MRKRKSTKTIDDVSVSKLLDDFVDLDVEEENKRKQMNDDEYIRMMVEKENERKLERAKRILSAQTNDEVPPAPDDAIVELPPRRPEPLEEVFPESCEHDLSPEDEADIDEIMKSQSMMEEPVLTGRMKTSVEFLQDEISFSQSKRNARKTLEKYRKDRPISKEKEITPIISKKRAPIKRCQNCYFCVGERKVSGSCWCHCSNPGRSTHAVVKGSWVKSRINLPCWKPPQD